MKKRNASSPQQDFSKASAKRDGASRNEFLETLLRVQPALRDETAYFAEEGSNSHVAIIGNQVFKAPYRAFDAPDLMREARLLKRLEGAGLPLPKVTCIDPDNAFYGMTRMPGIALSEAFKGMTDAEKRTIAGDIADFVFAFSQALPPKKGKYLAHGDLNAGNIYVDPETKRLSGVIDPGYAGYVPRWRVCPSFIQLGSLKFGRMVKQAYKQKKSDHDRTAPAPQAGPHV